MRIHMVASVRDMLHPEKVNGFGREHIACDRRSVFLPPERFHTSRPDEVTCLTCRAMLDVGLIDLVPMTAGERAALRLENETRWALQTEMRRSREFVSLTA